MNNLTTRKIVLGLLMTFVLAFSVQGIAEALTFSTSRSGDLATESPTPNDFDIRFSVSLKGNAAIRDNNGNLIKDRSNTGTAGARIDSSGYLVVEINGSAYRIISETPSGFLVIDPRPTYNDETPGTAGDPNANAYYVDTNNRVVDADGEAVYVRTGTGTRFDDNDTPATDDDTAASPWRYTRATAQPATKVPDANRYYYNQEQVTIAVTGADITHVGRYDITNAASHSLMETGKEGTLLSSSITLTLEADAAAVVTITISDTTPEDDLPNGIADRAPAITFTVYVVGPLNAAGTTTVASATDGVERVSDQSDTRINGHFTFNPAGNEPVYYSVEGSGRLYVSPASDRKTSSTNNLYTSSSAPVYLDTNGGSSKVTAYIAGSGNTATVLYLFSGGKLSTLPKIEVQSGSPQTGAPSGRLDDYFEVKVTDGRRRPISGLPVKFSTVSPSGALFIPVPGTRVYAITPPTSASIDAVVPTITEATATIPAAAATHYVQTDRNGVAKIYYQLSSNPGAHTVTAAAYGTGRDRPTDLSATLNATASSETRAGIANLEIVSGNNQSAEKGKFLTDDLVVIVRSLAGHRVQNVIIQFRTTTGTLVPSETTSQPDTVLGQNRGTVLHPLRGHQIYVETGPNGEAGVTYNVGQLVQARDVIAEVREEAQETTQYDFAIDRVVFNVNGRAGTGSGGSGGSGGGGSDPTNTITISLSETSGEPGDEIDVTVSTSSATPDFVVIDDGDFSASDFDDLSGRTPHETTLTLPDEEGEYDFFAVGPGGVTSNEVTVTVEAGILGTISISQIGTPSNGRKALALPSVDTDRRRSKRCFDGEGERYWVHHQKCRYA